MGRDIVDIANNVAMHETDNIIKNHLNRKEGNLRFTGRCHNCEDTVAVGGFCDDDCRDDYDKRSIKRKRDGYIS